MNKLLISAAIVAGIVLCYISYVYFSHAAGALPAYFPGYEAGSTHVHLKHAIASLLLGLASFVFAWFRSGPKQTAGRPPSMPQ